MSMTGTAENEWLDFEGRPAVRKLQLQSFWPKECLAAAYALLAEDIF